MLIFVLCGYSGITQAEISGFVKSSITDSSPIAGVYIEIMNLAKPIQKRMVSTDSRGFFRFENLKPGKDYQLKISCFGYADQTFQVKARNSDTSLTLILEANCEFNREQAEMDWEKGTPNLLLVGSIAPIQNSPADYRFEKKFGVKYYDFGCTAPIDDCIKVYNERIFELLDGRFGEKWRNEVRQDVKYFN